MPRPLAPPRLDYDDDRDTWVIRHAALPGKRRRLGIPRGEADAAQRALAEYVLALGATAPKLDRQARRVPISEVLERYLARRTDDDAAVRVKTVARPKELGQRVSRLALFWASRSCAEINEATCEDFAAYCGSASYARRCLGDLQSAISEATRAGMLREIVRVSMPPAPDPREDYLTPEEAVAIAWTCWRHRDEQRRRTKDGLRKVRGKKRPWAHLIRFMTVAIATCSRSARVFRASYVPEPNRPFVDLDAGLLYRRAPGERQTKKQAPPVPLNPRLVAAMRRWSTDRTVAGAVVTGDRYVVQYHGRAVDCKGAWTEAVAQAVKDHPTLFKRRDGSPKRIVRHSLRHTGITWLAMTPGIGVEDILAFAGVSRAMFDRVYAHHHHAAGATITAAQARKRPKPKKPEGEDA